MLEGKPSSTFTPEAIEGVEGVEVLKGKPSSTFTALALMVLMLGTATQCTNRSSRQEDTAVAPKGIEQVLEAHNDSLMALPGVIGTAIGRCDGAPCIRVFLADSASARSRFPERLDGYPVRVEVTGPVRPRAPSPGSEGGGGFP